MLRQVISTRRITDVGTRYCIIDRGKLATKYQVYMYISNSVGEPFFWFLPLNIKGVLIQHPPRLTYCSYLRVEGGHRRLSVLPLSLRSNTRFLF